jgi:hypothetical protein
MVFETIAFAVSPPRRARQILPRHPVLLRLRGTAVSEEDERVDVPPLPGTDVTEEDERDEIAPDARAKAADSGEQALPGRRNVPADDISSEISAQAVLSVP